MTQNNHFTLVFRQQVEHLPNPVVALAFHHLGVGAFFREMDHFENVAVIAGLDSGSPFYFPK